MIRRLPVLPTILVLAAVGVMIALGFWQLDRRDEKAAMLARYEAAAAERAEVRWPADPTMIEDLLYRRARLKCEQVTGTSAIAGSNAAGQPGLAVVADCRTDRGAVARVVLGWSREPVRPDWTGGEVRGVIAPGPRLVADPPLAGLEPSALPDPRSIPDNHLAYAVQWFFFAATALVIYALAVRKRLAGGAPRR